VLSTAAINEARFDYNPSTLAPLGLLIEQSSTNLELYSGAIGGTGWTNTRLSANTTANIAPDGTQTATLLTEDTSTNSHLIYNATALTITNATSYTVTRYAKQAGRTWLNIVPSFSSGSAYFDLANVALGTVTNGTATITSVGNGWCKCTFTVTTNATSGFVFIQLASANGTNNYTGNGTSGIYIWGAQLEALAFPTSYISTTSAQVTRASDSASMTGTNFSSWYNASQGTVYIEGAGAEITSGNRNFYTISDNTGSNRIQSAFGNLYNFFVVNGGVAQATLVSGTDVANVSSKNAGVYQQDNFLCCKNGATVSSDSSGTIPTVNRIYIGANADGTGAYLNGRIKKLAYYPQTLTSAQLQALTT
jgi:hypothetical protein